MSGSDPSAAHGVLLDYAQDKVALLDDDGQFTFVNAAVERILGYAPADLVGTNAFEYVHPEDAAAAREAFERTLDAETFTQRTAEYRFRAADGEWVWLESRMSNLTDEELDGYVVSSRDVSDRVVAQRERRETASQLRELSAATGDVLWLFTGDWSELLFVNPAYEAVYGQSIETIEADPEAFLRAVHPEDRSAVEAAMERLSAGESVDMEYRVNPETGYGVWVWVQAEPIVEGGEVVRITGFSRDVTERRRRERQLYVMDNLLRHNLRNDLGVILGNAELIAEEAPQVAERTAVIRETGEDLLESAEKERRIIDLITADVSPRTVDLVGAVGDAARAVRERYPEAVVTVDTPETTTVSAVDEVRVAVLELLENAVAHCGGSEPRASVRVTVAPETVTLTVTDDAAPIPTVEANVLTGDHEMDDLYHSSGLGLWLVYWTVELSDGSVTVEAGDPDPDGDGNVVRVRLPRAGPSA